VTVVCGQSERDGTSELASIGAHLDVHELYDAATEPVG
jgi:hypothetical protein